MAAAPGRQEVGFAAGLCLGIANYRAPGVNAELNALKDALDGQREHVLGILDGLPEQDLRRPVLPTGWGWCGT